MPRIRVLRKFMPVISLPEMGVSFPSWAFGMVLKGNHKDNHHFEGPLKDTQSTSIERESVPCGSCAVCMTDDPRPIPEGP